tara:strand:- start:257 stop:451 length:195 start_codon:yes stop_codon:yes gene_type:complete
MDLKKLKIKVNNAYSIGEFFDKEEKDFLMGLITTVVDSEKIKDDDGECSVCGTTAPRMYPNLMK